MFLAPRIFLGKTPEILDRHYYFRFTADHHAKFRGDRPTELGDLALKRKKHLLQNVSPFGNYRSGRLNKRRKTLRKMTNPARRHTPGNRDKITKMPHADAETRATCVAW